MQSDYVIDHCKQYITKLQKVEAYIFTHFFIFKKQHMVSQFKTINQRDNANTKILYKEPATVLEGFTFWAIDAGWFIVKATAASPKIIAILAVLSATEVLVSIDETQEYEMTSDAPFTESMRGTEIDLIIDGNGNQIADVGASTTDVLVVMAWNWPWRVWATKVLVKINKMIPA